MQPKLFSYAGIVASLLCTASADTVLHIVYTTVTVSGQDCFANTVPNLLSPSTISPAPAPATTQPATTEPAAVDPAGSSPKTITEPEAVDPAATTSIDPTLTSTTSEAGLPVGQPALHTSPASPVYTEYETETTTIADGVTYIRTITITEEVNYTPGNVGSSYTGSPADVQSSSTAVGEEGGYPAVSATLPGPGSASQAGSPAGGNPAPVITGPAAVSSAPEVDPSDATVPPPAPGSTKTSSPSPTSSLAAGSPAQSEIAETLTSAGARGPISIIPFTNSSTAIVSSTSSSAVASSTNSASTSSASSSVSTESTSSAAVKKPLTVLAAEASVTSTVESSSTSTTSAPASSSSPAPLTPFQEMVISYHDRVRALHSAPPMIWNDTLATFAQNYLNTVALPDHCDFRHSGGPYGENVALGFRDQNNAMAAWYNEGELYNYTTADFSEATGHFTQVVWVDSTQIGCALQPCEGNRNYFICEYYPRGNILGEFRQNVLPN